MNQPSPSPLALLSLAEEEEKNFKPQDYWQTIAALRKKGFSWRYISNWFGAKGVEMDHTAIYRFIKGNKPAFWASLPDEDFEEAMQTELRARESDILEFDAFVAQQAVTNANLFQIDEFIIGDLDISSQKGLKFEVDYHSSGTPDSDRGCNGYRISGTIQVLVPIEGAWELKVTAKIVHVESDEEP